jgi:hypothetical protein
MIARGVPDQHIDPALEMYMTLPSYQQLIDHEARIAKLDMGG